MATLLADWRHGPTHRHVWALATPMILSNLSVPLVTLVDSTVAGHLPHTSDLAAVAVGSAIYTLPAWCMGFLRMGTTGFAAQAHGSGSGTALRTILAQALLLAALMGLFAGTLMWPVLPWLIAQMHPSAALGSLGLQYLHLRLFGLPAAILNYALAGWFIGKHDTRSALYLLLVTNLVNIALNLLLVPGLKMGVPGIACASVGGVWCGSLFGLNRARGMLRNLGGRADWQAMRKWTHWRPLLLVNRDIFLRTLALVAVFFSMSLLGTRLGDAVVAANTLLLNGLMVTAFGLDGFANAIEALTGHAIGARDTASLRRALVVAGGWSLLGSLGFALFFTCFGHLFVDLQTSLPAVRRIAYRALPWLTILPLAGVWSYLLDGLFVGATRAREMRNGMLLSALLFGLLAWACRDWGNNGLWLAFVAFMAMRGASLGFMAWRLQRHGAWIASPATG